MEASPPSAAFAVQGAFFPQNCSGEERDLNLLPA